MKSDYFPKFTFNYKNKDFQKVITNMVPGLLGVGLLQFTTLINLRFSSSLHEGTISYINYVDRLIELPLSLISVSLGTALLPALSGFVAKGEIAKLSQTTRQYLELNLLMTMAAAAGLYVLAHPSVQLLFGHGRFSAEDVLATALILKTYCWIMIFSSAVRVLTPAYYAVKNTWFPAVVSLVCLLTHLVVAPYMMQNYGVHGLMISTIISATLNLTFLLAFFPKLVCAFEYWAFAKNIFVFAVIGILAALAANIYFVVSGYLPEGKLFLLANILFSILSSVVVFLSLGHTLKIKAIREVSSRVLSRLRIG